MDYGIGGSRVWGGGGGGIRIKGSRARGGTVGSEATGSWGVEWRFGGSRVQEEGPWDQGQ